MRKILTLILILTTYYMVTYAQVKTITGVVKDNNSLSPIAGVTVSDKHGNSTQTDVTGSFSIETHAIGQLTFRYVGYQSQTLALASQTTLHIFLSSQDEALEEIVVVGYGTQRKVDLTGAITSVKGSEIENMPNVTPLSSLQGKVAGLTISNSGDPGAAPTVRIRGVNSTNSAGPLYVVDGVLHDNIDFLNPGDIESMDILRDPSSIAIYGLRGANGVIAITLKKAVKGRTTINLVSSVGFNRVIDKVNVTNAEGFKELYNRQLVNLNAKPFDYTNYTADTDWQDLIMRNDFSTNNNLSISNSGEKSSTHFSIGYNKQNGVIKNSDYERFTTRLHQELKITDRFRIGGDITGMHWNKTPTVISFTNALWSAPIVPVQYDENTFYSMPSFQRTQVGNPMATLSRMGGKSLPKGYRFVANAFAEWEIIDNLKLKSTVYTDLGFNNSRGYGPLPFHFINLGEHESPTTTTYDETVYTSVNQSADEFTRFQQDHTLTYDGKIDNDHRFTAMAGFTTVYNHNTFLNANRRDTTLNIPNQEDYWYINVSNENNPGTFSGRGEKNSVVGAFARINYAYQDKYLLNATIRRDGSSKFAKSNRWGTFGSLGVGWVMSSEEFFKTIEAINFLKLRAAWGKIGNSNGIADNIYQPGLTNANTAVFGDNVYTAVQAEYIPDPNLHWEVVRGIDIGAELRALGNRLNAEINLYDRTTTDMLTQLPIPNDTRSYFTNLGKVTNKGIEVSLGWSEFIGQDFSYAISGNYSYNKNKVNSVGDHTNFQIIGNGGANMTETGRSIGYFYGYKQIGVYQSLEQMENIAVMEGSLPGDIAYADINGDGKITTADRTYLGTPFPPHNFGLSINLAYKNFDFLIEGQGVAGNHIYAQRRTANFATLNYESNRLDAWTGPGSTNVEPILDNSRGNNYLFSTHYLEPGDFFRIRTLQVGYTFDTNLFHNKVKKARLYISGQNLKTWSKVTGYSPEAPISNIIGGGADNGIYPLPATYTFGFNLLF